MHRIYDLADKNRFAASNRVSGETVNSVALMLHEDLSFQQKKYVLK